ncbi:MAG: TonB-dependent receptor [Gammaproteobacteria bacterium]|nr:TonB-dependent receptor [Gammaproteobacteria bacterium]MCH1550965.1 TonB-dependent receptor [Pseudomonadales bacterium]
MELNKLRRVKSRNLKVITATLLSSVIAAPAFAQETDDTIEEVIVTAKSIKASQMAAIEAKRMTDNVADVISADAIGRFPDQNLADALGRVPGVSIERDQGQARYISFRGAPKRYTTTSFDGIEVPGVENGRIPRFDAYPAVITSQVIANKAITADMPGESVSGYIDVKTFSPSDIEGWSLSLEGGVGEQDLGGGDIHRVNGRVSFSNDRFGLVLYGSENMREQVTDNREPEYTGSEGALVPDVISFRNYLLRREDEAYGGAAEFYFDNGARVFIRSLNTQFTDLEERNQWNFYFDDAPAQTGNLDEVGVRRYLQDGKYTNETDVNTIGADFSVAQWDVEVSYSQIETFSDTFLPIPLLLGGSVSNAFYDIGDGKDPTLTFDENLADLSYPLPLLVDAIGTLDTETDQFKFDISRANNWGELKAGFKYDSRDAKGGGAPLATVTNGLVTVDYQPEETPLWDTDLNNSIGGYYADNKGIYELLQLDGKQRSDFPEDERLEIEETIISAYIMQTVDMDWGNIIFGVRVEDTDYETKGSRLEGQALVPLSVSKDYTNVLPNAHVNWDVADDHKLRLSFSTGISRPTYIEARAAASINEVFQSVSGGNPNLKEETSWGLDAAWEWYFDEASLLSVTAFYRSIDNVIAESNERVLGSVYSDLAEPGELWDLSAYGNGKDGKLQGLELAFTGRLDNYIEGFFSGFGIEANLTLIDSEYTTPSGLKFDLPGQSDTTFNASLFYEDYGFSARVSYRYRDAWLDETETAGVFGLAQGVYWDAQKRIDLSIRYDLEPLIGQNVSVFLDANNLTDEKDLRYTGESWNPNQIESYGRRYVVGVRYNL